jgi:hypothetical protein
MLSGSLKSVQQSCSSVSLSGYVLRGYNCYSSMSVRCTPVLRVMRRLPVACCAMSPVVLDNSLYALRSSTGRGFVQQVSLLE